MEDVTTNEILNAVEMEVRKKIARSKQAQASGRPQPSKTSTRNGAIVGGLAVLAATLGVLLAGE